MLRAWQLSIAAFENEDLPEFEQRSANDKVRLPSLSKSFLRTAEPGFNFPPQGF
jgi:hypothetical protein